VRSLWNVVLLLEYWCSVTTVQISFSRGLVRWEYLHETNSFEVPILYYLSEI